MIRFSSLFMTEVRRCLSRRAVKVLVAIGALMIVATGVIAFFATKADEVTHGPGDGNIALLADLWRPEGSGTIVPALFLLIVGALIGGAVVVGGEWRAGTVVTLATWEPRRLRLLGARLLACGVLAATIGLLLVVLFILATLPVVFAKGSTAGLDVAALAGGVARGLSIAAFAAVLGAVVASLGRSSTAAAAGLFAYNAIAEPVMRGVWPERAGWLLGENVATWLSFERLTGVPSPRDPVLAGVTLLLYLGVAAAVALVVFQRRDLAGQS